MASLRARKRSVKVNDLMQRGYVYYLTEPTGKSFHPDFKPELTPKEMLELGVFGGKYLTDCRDGGRRCCTGRMIRERSDG